MKTTFRGALAGLALLMAAPMAQAQVSGTPTGTLASAANQSAEIAKLSSIHSDLGTLTLQLPAALGPKTSAASVSVTFANDQQLPGFASPPEISCLVVSADQTLAAGTPAPCTMTPTGRIKVGLSSAQTNGITAAPISDLAGAIDPSGNQQALQTDANKNLKVAGFAAVSSASVARPANTIAYTANTAWSTSTSSGGYLTFAGACPGGSGRVVLLPAVRIVDFANQSTKLTGTLWLFNAAPAAPIADDATFNVASADLANMVAQPITFAASVVANQSAGASGSVIAPVTGSTYEILCGASTSLYGMIQVTNAYAPVSAEQLAVTLQIVGVN